MRVDKWLWAARFFKTRSLAAEACEMGRVQLAGVNAKPARDISIGNELRIRSGHGDFVVHVAGLSEFRGPASEAQKLYTETEESIEARKREVEMRRAMPPTEVDRVGKPSKRDRRQIDRLRRT